PETAASKDVEYCFHWGDGSPDECQDTPTRPHVYSEAGAYQVSVSAAIGKSKGISSPPLAIQVSDTSASKPAPPVRSYRVSLSPGSLRPKTGQPDLLTATLNRVPDHDKKVEYCFFWGDGSPPTCQLAPSAVHVYRSKGPYLALVKVSVGGMEVAASELVEIVP